MMFSRQRVVSGSGSGRRSGRTCGYRFRSCYGNFRQFARRHFIGLLRHPTFVLLVDFIKGDVQLIDAVHVVHDVTFHAGSQLPPGKVFFFKRCQSVAHSFSVVSALHGCIRHAAQVLDEAGGLFVAPCQFGNRLAQAL